MLVCYPDNVKNLTRNKERNRLHNLEGIPDSDFSWFSVAKVLIGNLFHLVLLIL